MVFTVFFLIVNLQPSLKPPLSFRVFMYLFCDCSLAGSVVETVERTTVVFLTFAPKLNCNFSSLRVSFTATMTSLLPSGDLNATDFVEHAYSSQSTLM